MCVRVCACACVRVWSAGAPHTGRVKSPGDCVLGLSMSLSGRPPSPPPPPLRPERAGHGPAPRPEGEAALGLELWAQRGLSEELPEATGHCPGWGSFSAGEDSKMPKQSQRRKQRDKWACCVSWKHTAFSPACSLGCYPQQTARKL